MFNLNKISLKLETLTIDIKVFKPFKFSPIFLLFSKLKDFQLFQTILKYILRIPYWLLGTPLGGLFTQICFIWLFVGREPFTVILSGFYISELISLMLCLKYFLHIEGTYAYCIEIFGVVFMEKYVGNPFGPLAKKAFVYGLGGTLAFGLDHINQQACHERAQIQFDKNVKVCSENMTKPLTYDQIQKLNLEAHEMNKPRVDQFSDTIKTMLGSFGKGK